MKRNIFGVMIDDIDRRCLTEEISKRLSLNVRTVIFTPNPIMVQNAKKDGYFMKILNAADYNIPDGNGIVLASRLLKSPIKERICGIDLAEELLETLAKKELKLFLYGGREGVAELAAKKLRGRYPNLQICGYINGFAPPDTVLKRIKQSSPDVIYVCLGSPKQERWIHENMTALDGTKLFMGLGGSLDVWSGKVTRAPKCARKIGMEWLWRMVSSPKKLKDFPKLVAFGASAVAKRLFVVGIMHR